MPITNETRERAVALIDHSATNHLMVTVAKQLRATPIELVLTTLVCAYSRHFGVSQMDLAYLGHGRKDPLGRCDVSRTFPLVFRDAPNSNLIGTLRAVQATLNAGVDNGFLYTVIKNLHDLTDDQSELKKKFDIKPQFGFTYLDDMSVRDFFAPDTLLTERPAMLNDLRTMKSQNKYPYLLDFGAWNTASVSQ
ncbi:hypothetical protein BJ085DRAFT_34406 [Dimargaris cristalligena]|uniref:Condensation domain-containing protein n=1 Tax=Dimargaris cristalligena TaxID=215637 RepID=A0A4V1J478_9FUNG|nr:hypothetical protein BJ085DRAFT_34406 [Dimargaris cristalligena]|eukprot:RKP34609.1 hypothetical protein BJ085DRAFT_34406 [Dimargaris cristalligena]